MPLMEKAKGFTNSGVTQDMKSIWTKDQILFLKENYENMKTAGLLATLTDKTNDQLRWKANDLGLKKKVTKAKTDMTWLENFDDPNTCYWWGFIVADGCINHRQLIVSVHERDKEHLQIFANKSAANMRMATRKEHPWHEDPYTMARVALDDKFTLKRLREKLKILPRKTYNPLDLSIFFTPNRLAYFLGGLIDGDGHIEVRRQNGVVKIAIKVHSNWRATLETLAANLWKLYAIEAKVRVTKEGWVCLLISKARHVARLYDLVDGRVPLMHRKWKKLDEVRLRCQTSNGRRFNKIGINPSANLF